jgi:hypothetical protein
MPYKCTMIVDFLHTNCHECDVCALIIYMWILFKNFAFNPNEEFMWKLEVVASIFIWWALDYEGFATSYTFLPFSSGNLSSCP